MALPENPNIFANNPLDRASCRRTDKGWIEEQIQAPTSLFVPMWKLQPFVLPEAGPGEGKDIGWMRTALIPELAGDGAVVFLGINKRGKALFAADVSGLKDPENHPSLKGLGSFEDLRAGAYPGERPPTGRAFCAPEETHIVSHTTK